MTTEYADTIYTLEAMRLFAYNVSAEVRAQALVDHFQWNAEFAVPKWTKRLETGGSIPFAHMDKDTALAYVAMAVEWYPNSAAWEKRHDRAKE